MDRKSFEKGLAELSVFFQRNIKEEYVPLFYEKLEFIPTAAWLDICEQAVAEWDTWPRNIVKVIKAMWFKWQKPKDAKVDFRDCKFCDQTGCLDYSYFDDDWKRWLDGSCWCGHCDNYLRHISSLDMVDQATGKRYRHVRYTINEIGDMGWRWSEPLPDCSPREAFAAIKKMHKELDERSKAARLPKFEQEIYNQGRPSRHQSLVMDKERDEDIPF